jgi:hypothetical protein
MTDDSMSHGEYILFGVTFALIAALVFCVIGSSTLIKQLEDKLRQVNCIKIDQTWICPNMQGKYVVDDKEVLNE